MGIAFECNAFTQSGRLTYIVEITALYPETLNTYVNIDKFGKLCKLGCVNYGQKWSCPPYAPSFQDFAGGWDNLYVLYMRIATSQFSYIKNDYLKIKAANSILKSRADRFLRIMTEQNGKFISTGSCRLCKPCKRKLSANCARPNKMTYSFEALGVDVGTLVNKHFCAPLLWYKPGYLPEYTAVVCGLLTNEFLSEKTLLELFKNFSF
jgi:predicted metal-binding protein